MPAKVPLQSWLWRPLGSEPTRGPCQGDQHSKSSHRAGVPATPSASPRQGTADGAGMISHAVNTANAFLMAQSKLLRAIAIKRLL